MAPASAAGKKFELLKIPGETNTADVGTKHLGAHNIEKFSKDMGMMRSEPGGEALCIMDDVEQKQEESVTELVSSIFGGAMMLPQSGRHKILRLILTAATLASAKASPRVGPGRAPRR